MRFKDLQSETINKDITHYRRMTGNKSRSKGQAELGEILASLYPNVPIYEEVPAVGTRLFLDFFIPSLMLIVEYDGIQHEEYNAFFHGDRYGYLRSKERDNIKKIWCDINNFKLIRITEKTLSLDKVKELINDR